MENMDNLKRNISALFDGELESAEYQITIKAILSNKSLRAYWQQLCLQKAALNNDLKLPIPENFGEKVHAKIAVSDFKEKLEPTQEILICNKELKKSAAGKKTS